MDVDKLKRAAEQYVAACEDENAHELIEYFEELFKEALVADEAASVADRIERLS